MKKALIALALVALVSIIVLSVANANMFSGTDNQDFQGMQNMMGKGSDFSGMQNMMNSMHGNAQNHQQMHEAMEKAIENSGDEQLIQMHEQCEKMMGFQDEA